MSVEISIMTPVGAECEGKAFLAITYSAMKTRRVIKKTLGGTFFGIPYRMRNL